LHIPKAYWIESALVPCCGKIDEEDDRFQRRRSELIYFAAQSTMDNCSNGNPNMAAGMASKRLLLMMKRNSDDVCSNDKDFPGLPPDNTPRYLFYIFYSCGLTVITVLVVVLLLGQPQLYELGSSSSFEEDKSFFANANCLGRVIVEV
jgi:hypothetical protein